MKSSVGQPPKSDLVRSLDTPRLQSDPIGPTLYLVTRDALIASYGSVKATAYALGEGAGQPRLDESLMQREFKAGDFKRLQYASQEAIASVAAAQIDAFGPMARTPLEYAEQKIDQCQAALNEVRQIMRAIA